MINKKFLNDNGRYCVSEMIDSMISLYGEKIRKLKDYNVIIRSDIDTVKNQRVSIVSGGGSGHEPAMGGYCGQGMLTAAVCGEVFASPSVDSILACLRTVTGNKGCLCIVMNYTGDRLNFGLAAEQAKVEGYNVEVVFVSDDCALEGKGITGRRGIAGTVLVHKVAGALAEQGVDLPTIADAARQIASHVRTMGIALSVCNVPGKAINTRLVPDDGSMEVGLGIHGEAGRESIAVQSTDIVSQKFLDIILGDFHTFPEDTVLLLNNLGSTTPIEMMGLARAILLEARKRNIRVQRFFCGPAMTSLEMHGISLSVLDIGHIHSMKQNVLLDLLDAPTNSIGWKPLISSYHYEFRDVEIDCVLPARLSNQQQHNSKVRKFSPEEEMTLREAISKAAHVLLQNEERITSYDLVCGDGDCGETFARGAQGVLQALQQGTLKTDSLENVFGGLGEIARGMGGSSGAVLAIFFKALEREVQNGTVWKTVLRAGCDAISHYSGAQRGMRTLLDTLEGLYEALDQPIDLVVAATLAAADATKQMQGCIGRSSYLAFSAISGTPDPGAVAVAVVVASILQSYK